MSNEIEWRDIPGYEGLYRVNKTSDVYSVRNEIVLKPHRGTRGYSMVVLCNRGHSKPYLNHRLAMLAFVGASDLDVNHKNGNPGDNRLENLEYVTHRENILHARDVLKVMHWHRGETHPKAKLTESQVREIRASYIKGVVGNRQLARKYGVTHQSIDAIIQRKSWKHIE